MAASLRHEQNRAVPRCPWNSKPLRTAGILGAFWRLLAYVPPMDYLNILTALEGTEHFNRGLTLLNALPKSGQLTFIGEGDMIGWVCGVAKRNRVDHQDLMTTMAFMLEEEMLKAVDLGLDGLYMVGVPGTF